MVQCIYALMKSVYDENYYSPGQAFAYSVVRVNPKSKGDLNLAKIDLLRKLGIYYNVLVHVWFLLYMLLPYVKLFFLSGKRTFYHPYLIYIVYIDFFDHSSRRFFFAVAFIDDATKLYKFL